MAHQKGEGVEGWLSKSSRLDLDEKWRPKRKSFSEVLVLMSYDKKKRGKDKFSEIIKFF